MNIDNNSKFDHSRYTGLMLIKDYIKYLTAVA